MNYKELLKQILIEVVESTSFDITTIEKFFTSNYTQQVNDKSLNHQQFVAHIKELKQVTTSCKLQFINMISESNKVHSTHMVSVTKTDGSLIKMKVIGLFTFTGEKIARTEEITCLLSGSKQDEDLGYRH